MARVEERVENIVSDRITELGYEIYDIEYAKEGKDYFLRIYIDNEQGIDLNDCEKVNDAISDLLDDVDIIKEQYFLEISSPGVERILRKDKHFENNIGKEIEIKLFKNLNGKKALKGILNKYDKENIYLNIEEEIIEISRKDISLVKTVYNWDT